MAGPTQGSGATTPYQIFIGPPTQAPGIDITLLVSWDSIRIEETGNHDSATADFEILDKALAYTAIRGEWNVLISHGGVKVFRGTMGNVRPQMEAINARVNVSCKDIGMMLDRTVITTYGSNRRTNSESDKARISWLFNAPAGAGDWALPLMAQGLNVTSKVQTLNASMPNQSFPGGMTIRQGLERILSGSSESSDYYIDFGPRLHTYDNDHLEDGDVSPTGTTNGAPWDISLATSLGANEIAPDAFDFEWDSDKRRGALFIKGKNAAGSGYVTDNILGMANPFSNDLFGFAAETASAPDADTVAKRNRYAKAVLNDIRNPYPQGSFTVSDTHITNSGITWHGGQLVYITSTEHGLRGRNTDLGPWAGSNGGRVLQPFRIMRVTTTYVNGKGDRQMVCEIGGRRRVHYDSGS